VREGKNQNAAGDHYGQTEVSSAMVLFYSWYRRWWG